MLFSLFFALFFADGFAVSYSGVVNSIFRTTLLQEHFLVILEGVDEVAGDFGKNCGV
jgi:hypothetical protein